MGRVTDGGGSELLVMNVGRERKRTTRATRVLHESMIRRVLYRPLLPRATRPRPVFTARVRGRRTARNRNVFMELVGCRFEIAR